MAMPNTIIPGTMVNAHVDLAHTERYEPAIRVERTIDVPQLSAFLLRSTR